MGGNPFGEIAGAKQKLDDLARAIKRMKEGILWGGTTQNPQRHETQNVYTVEGDHNRVAF